MRLNNVVQHNVWLLAALLLNVMLMFKIASNNNHGGQLGAREGGASASVGKDGGWG